MKYSLDTTTYYIQRMLFCDLSLDQFYQLAKLRQDVFIIEQQSIYSDLDGLDCDAMHYLYWSSDAADAALVGYARYRETRQGKDYKIERVVLAPAWRGNGLASRLMKTMIMDIKTLNTNGLISLSAQLSAESFYQRLGFVAKGESYDDGGIEHITMNYLC